MFGIINFMFVHYMIEQLADVYIPITQSLLLFNVEFETKAMFRTFVYFTREVHNMFLFNSRIDQSFILDGGRINLCVTVCIRQSSFNSKIVYPYIISASCDVSCEHLLHELLCVYM
jgi:hypothetical protein